MSWRQLRQIARIGILTEPAPAPGAGPVAADPAHELAAHVRALFGRALAIRAVDAGSCNGCELEMHALTNPYYNIEALGIRFVASPRHADLLLVTGPVSAHMEAALRRTYEAVPAPKRVVALGQCACDGGVFGCSYASRGPVAAVIPVDVEVPGCPPTPIEILRGILRAVAPAKD